MLMAISLWNIRETKAHSWNQTKIKLTCSIFVPRNSYGLVTIMLFFVRLSLSVHVQLVTSPQPILTQFKFGIWLISRFYYSSALVTSQNTSLTWSVNWNRQKKLFNQLYLISWWCCRCWIEYISSARSQIQSHHLCSRDHWQTRLR